MKKFLKFFVLMLVVSLVLSMTAFSAFATEDVVAKIGDAEYGTLKDAVDAANKSEGNVTITLLADVTLSEKLTIKKNTTINGPHTITRGYAGTLFGVDKDTTLTLDGGVVIDGNNNWTFDSENYYAHMAAGLKLNSGDVKAKHSYSASEVGGIVATDPMFSISGTNGAVVMNKATIQNNWVADKEHHNDSLFYIPAGATLMINDGALIKHVRCSVAGHIAGVWNMNGGKIEDVFAHNTNGGLADIRNGTVNINGGEITAVRTLGLDKNGNGILAQVFGSMSKLIINGGNIHDNASFAPGAGWGSVLYSNNYGYIEMNGGTISNTLSDCCSAFAHRHPSTDNLFGGTIHIEPSLAAWFDSYFYGDVTIGKDMNIVGADDSFFFVNGEPKTNTFPGHKLHIDGNISGGKMWLMYNEPVTGTGTITSDVLIKADLRNFGHDGKVTITDANWLDSVITVDSVCLTYNSIVYDASLTVKNNAYIDGVQIRVLDSVASGNYLNAQESAASQALAYVQEANAIVKSPVLYYHRLTEEQKQNIVVTFDYNGGLDAQGWSGCQLTAAEAFAPACPEPTKAGYELYGWKYAADNDPESLDMTGTTNYAGEELAESVRLVAVWGPIRTNIQVQKVDFHGDPMPGVEFTLYELVQGGKKELGTYTVNKKGTLLLENIVSNKTYLLEETKTPNGYKPVDPLTIDVTLGDAPDYEVIVEVTGTNGSFKYEDGILEIINLYEDPKDIVGDKTSDKIDDDTFEITVKVPGGDGTQVHDEVIVMVDGSYSVDEEWPAMSAAIMEIGKEFLDGSGNTQLTLMAFGMSPTVVQKHIKSVEELSALLNQYQGNLLYGRSSTNCAGAFDGIKNYIKAHDNTLQEAYVIYVTDGGVNMNNKTAVWHNYFTKLAVVSTVDKISAASAFCMELDRMAANVGYKWSSAAVDVFGDDLDDILALWKQYAPTLVFNNKGNLINHNIELYNQLCAYWNESLPNGNAKVMQWVIDSMDAFFENAGMDKTKEYTIYEVEKAMVDYCKGNMCGNEDAFYYLATKVSAIVSAGTTNNKQCAVDAGIEAAEFADHIYLVQYTNDSRAGWMQTLDDVCENVSLTKAAKITDISQSIKEALKEAVKTPYNDVTVVDYMSKWVLLNPETIRVVDVNGTVIAVFDAENSPKDENGAYTAYLYKWTEGNELWPGKAPIELELVSAEDYADGGSDVIGNASDVIYRIRWNIKKGALNRNDVYELKYEVDVDVNEPGFSFDQEYPANGITKVIFIDKNNVEHEDPIDVPDVDVVKPEPDTVTLEGTKYLDNEAGEGFEFAMKDAEGNVIEIVKSDAEGKFVFADLVCDALGEFCYTVSEVKGASETINYDATVYNVVVTVVKNGRAFEATVEMNVSGNAVDEIVFNNETVADAEATLGGTKYLDDEAGEGFEFVLKDADGNVIETVKSGADGKFVFTTLAYGASGEYKYTISEVIGDDETIVYDETVYNVTVTVVREGDAFVADVAIDAEEIVFNNETVVVDIPEEDIPLTPDVPEEPEEPETPEEPEVDIPDEDVPLVPDAPATGGEGPIALIILMTASAAMMAAVLIMKRKVGEEN